LERAGLHPDELREVPARWDRAARRSAATHRDSAAGVVPVRANCGSPPL